MSAVPSRVPTPRLKAPPTAGTTTDSATAFNSKTLAPPQNAPVVPDTAATTAVRLDSAQNNGHLAPWRPARAPPADPLSDKATIFLIRRTLCANNPREKGSASPAPVEELLPPLTSRNDIDLQLYAFLAIVLKEFVQNWYNRITPDQTFVAEIVQIIAHITRALEQRLRKVDLEHLVFHELPELLDRHVNAYRLAHRRANAHPVQSQPRQVYHSMFPLPHLSPVPNQADPAAVAAQEENEASYRQLLVQGMLAVLLPTEDLENECLTSLVGQILSELVLGGIVAKKASEPWLLWEGITILARDMARKRNPEEASTWPGGASSSSSADSPSQSDPPEAAATLDRIISAKEGWSIRGLFWGLVQWALLGYSMIRLLISTALVSRSLPSRIRPAADTKVVGNHKARMTGQNDGGHTDGGGPFKRPVLAFQMGPCVSNLLEMDSRMPWLCGVVSWTQWIAITGPGQLGGLDGIIDR